MFNRKKHNRKKSETTPCIFCRRVRVFMIVAFMLLVLIAFKVELSFLRGISLTAIAADFIGILVIVTLLWKGYHEYWKTDDRKDR